MTPNRRERGQAGVETAIVLPLLVFTLLGILQMSVAMQARIATEYAAFRAARAGSVYRNDCGRMKQAALLGVVPTLPQPSGAAGGTVAQRYQNLAASALTNRDHSDARGASTPLVVLDYAVSARRARFDEQLESADEAMKLTVRLTYFFRYRLPFVDAIIPRFWLATQTGAAWAGEVDPTLPVSRPRDLGAPSGTFTGPDLQTVKDAIQHGYYVTPIVATATMRMMSDPYGPAQGRCP